MIRRLMIPLVLTCLWSAPTLMAAPIHDAARDGDTHRIRELLSAGATVNAKDNEGATIAVGTPVTRRPPPWR